jgi:RNA polymerase sigma-70 factor (ECF subfamily)
MADAQRLFESLARDHADALWAYLRSTVRDRATAEDLFQETLLTAWRSRARYDSSLPFGPWLRGIAGRLLLARRRHLARDQFYVGGAEDLEALEAIHARMAARSGDLWESKLDLLRRCLEQLPEAQREVVRLYYWDNLACAAIAARRGQPLEAVKKRLQRARAALADCLQTRLAAEQEVAP